MRKTRRLTSQRYERTSTLIQRNIESHRASLLGNQAEAMLLQLAGESILDSVVDRACTKAKEVEEIAVRLLDITQQASKYILGDMRLTPDLEPKFSIEEEPPHLEQKTVYFQDYKHKSFAGCPMKVNERLSVSYISSHNLIKRGHASVHIAKNEEKPFQIPKVRQFDTLPNMGLKELPQQQRMYCSENDHEKEQEQQLRNFMLKIRVRDPVKNMTLRRTGRMPDGTSRPKGKLDSKAIINFGENGNIIAVNPHKEAKIEPAFLPKMKVHVVEKKNVKSKNRDREHYARPQLNRISALNPSNFKAFNKQNLQESIKKQMTLQGGVKWRNMEEKQNQAAGILKPSE